MKQLRQLLFQSALSRSLLFLSVFLLFYGSAKAYLAEEQSSFDITVGSKNFTESRILAEMYALGLEKAGYHVRRRFDLGGSLVAHAALCKGEIDVYPEYTGTGLLNILNHPSEKNEQLVQKILNQNYEQRWQLRWLKVSSANDSQALVVTKTTADQYNLHTISQLNTLAPRIRLATIPEFVDRDDGLKGLQTVYGPLSFQQIRQYDNGLKYQVLLSHNADVTVGFTTDGQLSDPQLVVLKDDKQFWPYYRVAPVIRESSLKKSPLAEGVLNRISALLDTETLRQLNAQVDRQKQEYQTVARNFLHQKQLI